MMCRFFRVTISYIALMAMISTNVLAAETKSKAAAPAAKEESSKVESNKGEGTKVEKSSTPAAATKAAPAIPPEEPEEESGSSLRDLFKTLDYPELQVVPRASKRLQMESTEEDKNWWYIHWPFYLSALSTMALGTAAEQSFSDDLSSAEVDDGRSGALVARVVGATWLFGTVLFASRKPYQQAWAKVKMNSGAGKANELLKERLSEEALEKPAHTMRVLSYVSAFSNLAAASYVGAFLDDQGKVFAALVGGLAFLPLVFDDWYVFNYNKHLEYKRNIFSPVVSLSAMNRPSAGVEYYPTLAWTWDY
ncbi:MAG: hypothetical protein IT288_06530 [Bdellovibrionales bacterium]|nr:hypothetical protein [Bdellovibrionales bacterium]